jgi:phosphatidylinositol-4,5-bisphosphate 3-kinase
MKQWEPLHPNEALPLLDAMISDESIRFYATERVASYRDDELVLYMLELT